MIEQKLTEEYLPVTVSFRVEVFLSVILNAKPLSRNFRAGNTLPHTLRIHPATANPAGNIITPHT